MKTLLSLILVCSIHTHMRADDFFDRAKKVVFGSEKAQEKELKQRNSINGGDCQDRLKHSDISTLKVLAKRNPEEIDDTLLTKIATVGYFPECRQLSYDADFVQSKRVAKAFIENAKHNKVLTGEGLSSNELSVRCAILEAAIRAAPKDARFLTPHAAMHYKTVSPEIMASLIDKDPKAARAFARAAVYGKSPDGTSNFYSSTTRNLVWKNSNSYVLKKVPEAIEWFAKRLTRDRKWLMKGPVSREEHPDNHAHWIAYETNRHMTLWQRFKYRGPLTIVAHVRHMLSKLEL
jgi:hypothetical protein